MAGGHRFVELKGLQVNGDDFWTNHSGGFLNDAGQQGLQPAMETLTWAYKEREIILNITLI